MWAPTAATLSETLETFRGSWSAQNAIRSENAVMMQTVVFLTSASRV